MSFFGRFGSGHVGHVRIDDRLGQTGSRFRIVLDQMGLACLADMRLAIRLCGPQSVRRFLLNGVVVCVTRKVGREWPW